MTQYNGQLSDGETENLKDFLTIEEAARLVGLSHWTIRLYLQKRRLTKYRLCNRTVVSRKELVALIHVEEIVPAGSDGPAKGRPPQPPQPPDEDGAK
jgi:excisionase family DNA binding protein